MGNLFAYGTLMCEDIMVEVSACHLSSVPGTLKGYSRRSVRGEHYPAIVADKESIVEGVVYLNVPNTAWERLDRFEGEMYKRQPVDIEMNDHGMLYAETYVIQPAYLNHLELSAWDFNDFISIGKASFKQHYLGYSSL